MQKKWQKFMEYSGGKESRPKIKKIIE